VMSVARFALRFAFRLRGEDETREEANAVGRGRGAISETLQHGRQGSKGRWSTYSSSLTEAYWSPS
jgi:hypothetical protein